MNEVSKYFEEKIKSIPVYYVEIGVFAANNKRKNLLVGVSNAELMFIHENGSPLRNIPSRPVLHMTLEYAQKELVKPALAKAIQAYLESNSIELYEKELEKLCMRMQSYARQIIYSNDDRLAPNAPSVAAKKKGNHPLFDTGQLARSITCRLVKGNSANGR